MAPASRYMCSCGFSFIKDFIVFKENGQVNHCLFCIQRKEYENCLNENTKKLDTYKQENTTLRNELSKISSAFTQSLEHHVFKPHRSQNLIHIPKRPYHQTLRPDQNVTHPVYKPAYQNNPLTSPPFPSGNYHHKKTLLPTPSCHLDPLRSWTSPKLLHPHKHRHFLLSQPNLPEIHPHSIFNEREFPPLSHTHPSTFTTVRNGSKQKTTTKTQHIKTSNKFAPLENIEDECEIYGDSLVRNIGTKIPTNKHRKRITNVYPGANIKTIREKIDKAQINQTAHLVVNTGSNDIFNKRAASEDIITRYKQLIRTMKDKCKNCIILETIPRLNSNSFTLSRAIGINTRVKQMCTKEGITYIDTWDTFINNRKLYKRDMTHPNKTGTETLARLIHNTIAQQTTKHFL